MRLTSSNPRSLLSPSFCRFIAVMWAETIIFSRRLKTIPGHSCLSRCRATSRTRCESQINGASGGTRSRFAEYDRAGAGDHDVRARRMPAPMATSGGGREEDASTPWSSTTIRKKRRMLGRIKLSSGCLTLRRMPRPTIRQKLRAIFDAAFADLSASIEADKGARPRPNKPSICLSKRCRAAMLCGKR